MIFKFMNKISYDKNSFFCIFIILKQYSVVFTLYYNSFYMHCNTLHNDLKKEMENNFCLYYSYFPLLIHP